MATANGLLENLGGDARALCKRTWWVFLVGGIASVIFGVLAFINPGIALLALAMFFAGSGLALASELLHENSYLMARLVCSLNGKVTFSYSCRDLREDREMFPASILLACTG